MNLPELNDWAALLWGPSMLRACGQGALAVAAVWIICRLFPRLPSSLRASLWWLACLKTLVSLSVVGPIQVAVLPADLLPPATIVPQGAVGKADAIVPPVSHVATSGADAAVAAEYAFVTSVEASDPTFRAPSDTGALVGIVFGLWAAGVTAFLFATGMGLHAVRRLVKEARPAADLPVVKEVADALGLRQTPTVLISERAVSTLVVGPWRPVVVLCRADLELLSAEELRALLAHELAHIRRYDLWAGLLPNLARLVFFFNPLVWLACREYDMAREAACDAEALQVSGMAPSAYGRLLLKLGIGPTSASRVSSVAALGAASPYGIQLRQRVQGLRWHRCRMPRWAAPVLLAVAVAGLCLHPVRVGAKPEPHVPLTAVPSAVPPPRPATTASKQSADTKTQARVRRVPRDPRVRDVLPALPALLPQTFLALNEPPAAESALAQSADFDLNQQTLTLKKEDNPMLNLSKIRKPKLPAAVTVAALTAMGTPVVVRSATAQEALPAPPAAPAAPVAPVAPVTPVAPVAPVAPTEFQGQENAQKSRYQYTLRRGNSYMNHTWDKDVSTEQRALAKSQAGDSLVVDRDGKRYLITDPATINQIIESYAPVEAIGKQMEALGKQMEEATKPMEALGKQMEELGKQMELLGNKMEEQGKLLEASYEGNKSEADRKAIQEKMRAIQDEMKTPQQAMKALSDKMREQSGKMRPYSDQMREQGNKIRAAAKEAQAKVFSAIDAAFQKNLAVEQKAQ